MARKMFDVKCVICGAEFQSIRSNAKYCSKLCKSTADRRRKRKPRPAVVKKVDCAQCGKEFTADYPGRKYCSVSCRDENDRIRRKERRKERSRLAPVRKCLICGNEFKSRNTTILCCSRECSQKKQKLRNYGPKVVSKPSDSKELLRLHNECVEIASKITFLHFTDRHNELKTLHVRKDMKEKEFRAALGFEDAFYA